MSILTEHIVLSRTRAQDLNSVRKLNCWGSELSDVSIVKRMSFVEVLSLSVNSISTLSDFAYCHNLQELYLRKNNIQDLNELCYLQNLPRLHSFWLADNPCAENKNYRLTVLRALPRLVKLDNIFVQPDEVNRAKTEGDPLINPAEAGKKADEVHGISPASLHTPVQDLAVDQQFKRSIVEPEIIFKHVTNVALGNNSIANVSHGDNCMQESSPNHSNLELLISPIQAVPPNTNSHRTIYLSEEDELNEMIHEFSSGATSRDISPQHQHAFQARVQTLVDHSSRRLMRKGNDIASEGNSCSIPIENYSHFDSSPVRNENLVLNNDPDGTASSGDGYRHSLKENGEFRSPENELHNFLDTRNVVRSNVSQRNEKGSPARFLPKGGRNRNSNILSAVLCLVKELDYASLEVVETAIHCRMEEMDD